MITSITKYILVIRYIPLIINCQDLIINNLFNKICVIVLPRYLGHIAGYLKKSVILFGNYCCMDQKHNVANVPVAEICVKVV